MPPANILSRANPQAVWVVCIQRQGANRVRGLIIKDWRPGGAGVDGFPNPARANSYVPGCRIIWLDFYMGDAPGHQRRTDVAQTQPFQGVA